MKNKIKALLLVLLLLLPFNMFGCGGKNDSEKLPDYSADINTLKFKIGMWVGVPNVLYERNEQGGYSMVKAMSQADFNKAFYDIKQSGINIATTGAGEVSKAYLLKALTAAETVGIDMIVAHGNLNQMLMSDQYTDDEAVALIEDMVADYKNHPRLYGHNIYDEPSILDLDTVEVMRRRYKRVFPDKLFYVNLYPNGAPVVSIGDSHEEYVQKFIDLVDVDYVSYDHYPLRKNAKRGTFIVNDYIQQLHTVKELADKADREMWAFAQCLSYSASTRKLDGYKDAAFQMYSSMAFGAACLQWFCYWTPLGEVNFTDGMVDLLGNKTPAYDYVSEVNKEVLAFDHVYLNYDWKGVITHYGSNNGEDTTVPNFERIEDKVIESERLTGKTATEDLLIGVFKDKEGRDGFMAVNFSDPGRELTNDVKLVFADCSRAVVYQKGKESVVNCPDGKLTLEMGSGEGCFIIPIK